MQCFMSDYMKSLIYCVEGNVSRAICNCFLLSLEVFVNAHFSRECLLEESSLHDDSVFICNYLRFLFHWDWGNSFNAQSRLRKQMFYDAVPVFSVKLCFDFFKEHSVLCSRNAALKRLQDGFHVFLPNLSRSQCLTLTAIVALWNTIFLRCFKNLWCPLDRLSCHCELSFNSDVQIYCHWGLDWKSTYAKSFALIQWLNMNVLWFLVTWNSVFTASWGDVNVPLFSRR